jgi:acetylornithine deacetylase/succinyl-diaminopimelate desuccinylase-like protein
MSKSAYTLLGALLGLICALHPAAAEDTLRWEKSARAMLAKAVAYRTAAGYGQVPALAAYLTAELRSAGFADQDIQTIPVGETAALIVRYHGDGRLPPMLLNSHMDVVDADPADWKRNPFDLTEENGYLFARGVADNKLGMTALVTTLMRLKSEGFTPNRDIILVLTGDEESTMRSTREVAGRFPDAAFLLNSDDVGGILGHDRRAQIYYAQGAEKTYASFTLRATSPGGHSSRPTRDNAIYALSHALLRLEAYAFPAQSNELTRAFFRQTAPRVGGPLGDAMQRFAADPTDAEALATLSADPEYIGITRTTCVATLLSAGHAENALPQSAVATVNCRIFPGTSIESVRQALVNAIGDPAIAVQPINPADSVATDASPLRADVMGALRAAVDANFPGLPIAPKMAAGASDCMWFRAAGIPSYVVPGLYSRPEDDFWHGVDERVPSVAIGQTLRHWYVLVTQLAGGH